MLYAGFFAEPHPWRRGQAPCSENEMTITLGELDECRQAILKGISQNLNYREIAAQLGVRRGDLIREVRFMRQSRDPGLLDAQRIGQAKTDEEKRSFSKKREEKFYNMTGMTFPEKSFQNMIHFYRPELMTILRSEDYEAAIRRLPNSIRRTLMHNGILTKRNKPQITQQALDRLR
jgi:IS30 family transposase